MESGAQTGWQAGYEAFTQGRTEEAVTLLQSAVQNEPFNADARLYLGAALAQVGRAGEAALQLREAAFLRPDNPQILFNLGVAQQMSGDNEAARQSYRSAVRLKPDYIQASEALTQLPVPVPLMVAPAVSAAPIPEPGAATAQAITPDMLQPNGVDFVVAFFAGSVAAVIGAYAWFKFVFYTGILFGLLAAAIGYFVGVAIVAATKKRGTGLQWMGAFLALFGMLLGNALLLDDTHIVDSFKALPDFFKGSPLDLIFLAIGVYEGWILPAAKSN